MICSNVSEVIPVKKVGLLTVPIVQFARIARNV